MFEIVLLLLSYLDLRYISLPRTSCLQADLHILACMFFWTLYARSAFYLAQIILVHTAGGLPADA